MQRRIVQRNERTLYKRSCDLCKKDQISVYPPDAPFPVYCQSCWWSDGWDAKSFGRDYDFSKTFNEQFKALQNDVPRSGILAMNSVNSDYTNNAVDNKNCYLIFAAEQNEDCMYGRLIQSCKSVVDGAFVYESERCYECVDCRKCFNCMFSERCQSSTDLLFCFDVRDSQNCILSTNARHAQYLIENVQHSKEEFEARKKQILASYVSIQKAKKRFEELKSQTLVKFAFQTKCNDAQGDYLFNCHEAYRLFDASNAKACAYLADAEDPIDCLDGNNMYYKPELCLDMMGILQCYNCKYCTYVFHCNEVEYSDNMHNCDSCFASIGLTKSKYFILNKEYSPEAYAELKGKIINAMKKEGVYGAFFDPQLSPFGYNETLAKDFFPMEKDEAVKKGFRWQDRTTGTIGKETVAVSDMPQTIDEVGDDILKDIFVCEDCRRNYRITPNELTFYRAMHLPIPHKDFECRHKARVDQRTPRELFDGKCQCAGAKSDNGNYTNTASQHKDHAPDQHCPNEFQTSYSPDRKEIVYCESCYQSEIL